MKSSSTGRVGEELYGEVSGRVMLLYGTRYGAKNYCQKIDNFLSRY